MGKMGELMFCLRLSSVVMAFGLLAVVGQATEPRSLSKDSKGEGSWPGATLSSVTFAPWDIQKDRVISPEWRERVEEVVFKPTLQISGQPETFSCDPNAYEWLLENPHHVVTMWKHLGAKCSSIERDEDGQFFSKDGAGTDIRFTLLANAEGMKIWFAQGQGKGGALLPVVPIKAVIVHQYQRSPREGGVTHQTTVYAVTDSKGMALLTKALGPAIPALARKSVSQVQMFFGAMAWYLEKNPDRAESLVKAALVKQAPITPVSQTGNR